MVNIPPLIILNNNGEVTVADRNMVVAFTFSDESIDNTIIYWSIMKNKYHGYYLINGNNFTIVVYNQKMLCSAHKQHIMLPLDYNSKHTCSIICLSKLHSIDHINCLQEWPYRKLGTIAYPRRKWPIQIWIYAQQDLPEIKYN